MILKDSEKPNARNGLDWIRDPKKRGYKRKYEAKLLNLIMDYMLRL